MRSTTTRAGEDGAGFSLVEVIIAIGVLAGVLLSISSMFMLGGRQVKAGKTITEATAICHDIMETFEPLSFTALYAAMGAAATDTSVAVDSATAGSPIESWQAEIDGKLENGVASVTLTPMGPGTPDVGTATAIRIRVGLTWNEIGRQQSVQLAAMRF
ncbi:MAG: hypothetical protein ACE5JH_06465 [Acidobacteriota bacterium]